MSYVRIYGIKVTIRRRRFNVNYYDYSWLRNNWIEIVYWACQRIQKFSKLFGWPVKRKENSNRITMFLSAILWIHSIAFMLIGYLFYSFYHSHSILFMPVSHIFRLFNALRNFLSFTLFHASSKFLQFYYFYLQNFSILITFFFLQKRKGVKRIEQYTFDGQSKAVFKFDESKMVFKCK